MTQEEKELLLKDLCARLPWSVKIDCFSVHRTLESISIDSDGFITIDCGEEHFYHPFSNELHKGCLPYLRSMESMTEKEVQEIRNELNSKNLGRLISSKNFNKFNNILWFTEMQQYECVSAEMMDVVINYLDRRFLDHRGLIPMGLALEAKEGMYNF